MAPAAKVFLDYTQQELDDAFEQTLWAPNFEALRAQSNARCAEMRQSLKHFETSYGPSADETLEIFPTAKVGAPVLLYVHGGRWKPQPDNAFIFFADTVVNAGAHFVAARFATLDPPKSATRMPDMVAQLRRAVMWLAQNAHSFGGDPARLHVIGHSSGAHLTSVVLTSDWPSLGAAETVLQSGACVSGIYELRPVLLSVRSAYVKLSTAEEDDLSAIRHLDRVRCPILVAYGEKESPEFRRQGREFAAALKSRGLPSQELVLPGCNHFEGIRLMMDPRSPLAQRVLAQMGLGTD
jgi:arylformamidase